MTTIDTEGAAHHLEKAHRLVYAAEAIACGISDDSLAGTGLLVVIECLLDEIEGASKRLGRELVPLGMERRQATADND